MEREKTRINFVAKALRDSGTSVALAPACGVVAFTTGASSCRKTPKHNERTSCETNSRYCVRRPHSMIGIDWHWHMGHVFGMHTNYSLW